MKYELIIVRYGELALKGKQSRKIFENTLIQNIKNALDKQKLSNKILKEWGRIYVYSDQIRECINVLKKIFGITSVSPAIQTKGDMESISKLAVEISKQELNKDKSFAIRAKRTGEHDYSSQDVAINIGNEIVKATGAKVDLNKPDLELFIEVRGIKAFIFTEKISSVGGLPLGSQGSICALIEDTASILAAWYLMKRGCDVFFVAPDNSIKKLGSFIKNWYAKPKISTVDFENNLYEQINSIADKNNCYAITVGYSLFDNPQKVLNDIKQLKKHIRYPILHPLIAMNKDEIIKKCKDIGLKI